jgi:hypothetical protein
MGVSYRIWGSQTGSYEEPVFRDITRYIQLKVNRRFGGTWRLHLQVMLATYIMLVSCLAYFTMNMEESCSSEMSVDFQRTTLRYIQEDRTLLQVYFLEKLSLPSSPLHFNAMIVQGTEN